MAKSSNDAKAALSMENHYLLITQYTKDRPRDFINLLRFGFGKNFSIINHGSHIFDSAIKLLEEKIAFIINKETIKQDEDYYDA